MGIEFDMFDHAKFSPVPSIFGGMFLGLFCFAFFRLLGRPLGVSGNLRCALLPTAHDAKAAVPGEFFLRLSFLAGMLFSAIIAAVFHPHLLQTVPKSPTATPKWGGDTFWYIRYLVGGVVVGFGTTMSNGCTTGHGLAGLSRLSLRSFVAVGCFMASAMAFGTAMNVSQDFQMPEDDYAVASPSRSLSAYIVIVIAVAALAAAIGPNFYYASSGQQESSQSRTIRICIISFICAFGAGSSLVLGGMALPSKIAAFLDFRNWDPSLMFLMAGAHVLQMPLTLLLLEPKVEKGIPPPVCFIEVDGQVSGKPDNFGWTIRGINKRGGVDKRLVVGALSFGVGWALCCACPAPAILRLAAFDAHTSSPWPSVHNLCLCLAWLACFALGSYLCPAPPSCSLPAEYLEYDTSARGSSEDVRRGDSDSITGGANGQKSMPVQLSTAPKTKASHPPVVVASNGMHGMAIPFQDPPTGYPYAMQSANLNMGALPMLYRGAA